MSKNSPNKLRIPPDTSLPIGTERLRFADKSRGYILKRKVSCTGCYTQDWRPVHRLNWLEAGREIPPGLVFDFKDGNSMNTQVENLELITRSERWRRNTRK
jgi:hypothetical protein